MDKNLAQPKIKANNLLSTIETEYYSIPVDMGLAIAETSTYYDFIERYADIKNCINYDYCGWRAFPAPAASAQTFSGTPKAIHIDTSGA